MNRVNNMKNLNNMKKITSLLLLSATGGVMATDITVPLNFTTLPEISVAEEQQLQFGDVLSLTQSNTCTMSTSAGTALTAGEEGADLTDTGVYAISGGAGTAGQLSGDCIGDDGQVGLYEITSFADADITVSVTEGSTGDIAFTPIGYVLDHDEAGTPTRETLNTTTDADVNSTAALSAHANAGTTRAVIGGTITNQVRLTAGDQYSSIFEIDIVYQ
jgi:hypothetical protein